VRESVIYIYIVKYISIDIHITVAGCSLSSARNNVRAITSDVIAANFFSFTGRVIGPGRGVVVVSGGGRERNVRPGKKHSDTEIPSVRVFVLSSEPTDRFRAVDGSSRTRFPRKTGL